MVDILAKVAPTAPEEITQFFMRVHDVKPGITEQIFGEARTREGHSSYELLCKEGEPLAGRTAVDLACGSGLLTALLASRVGPSGHVVGVDLNQSELALARARLTGVSNVQFLTESVQALSLPAACADVVLCHMAFMLFNPVAPVVREIARILKPGGVFAAVVSAIEPPNPFFREVVGKLTSVLREEIPHFEKLSWGQAEAKTRVGLQQLFSQDLGFLNDLQTTEFEVVLRDTPQRLSERILSSFYYNDLLSAEGARRVKAEWQALFEAQQDSTGLTVFHFPRTLFRVRKG
jgi:SAM-dependent methyltransferase